MIETRYRLTGEWIDIIINPHYVVSCSPSYKNRDDVENGCQVYMYGRGFIAIEMSYEQFNIRLKNFFKNSIT